MVRFQVSVVVWCNVLIIVTQSYCKPLISGALIPKTSKKKCFTSRLAFAFAQSIEARC